MITVEYFDHINKRLDRIETKVDRIDRIESKLDHITDLESRLRRVERNMYLAAGFSIAGTGTGVTSLIAMFLGGGG